MDIHEIFVSILGGFIGSLLVKLVNKFSSESTINMKYSIEQLKDSIHDDKLVKFLFFWGHTNKNNETAGKFCFSQWYPSPFEVEGVVYRTAEHWMMAKKALLFNDVEIFDKILNAKSPAEAKLLGREVKYYDDELWLQHRYEIVKAGNIHKFSQHSSFRDYLLQTAPRVIVEASPVDAIWGIGLSVDSKQIEDVNNWRGLNLLGFALMEVRDVLSVGK